MARRKHREGEGLQKVLGVPAFFSTAYGNVGSSIYYALGIVALSAMGATPLVFVITGLLFMTTAWTYAEATAAMPEAGGAASFARRAFNEFVSFGIGWGQMLVYTATIAISALFVPHYLSVFWPILLHWPYNAIGGIITAVFLVAINVFGIKEAARLNIILALLDLATQVLIMVIALALLLAPRILIEQIHFGIAPTWRQFLYGIAIGTVAYTGIETVSNMAEEATNPGRDVPKAINLVIIVVLAVYIGMPLAGLSAMRVNYNEVPMDPATHLTVPQLVVPSDPVGTWALKSDPEATVYVPVEEVDGTWVIPAQKPEGEVTTVDGVPTARLYGTQLGSNYQEDPVLGMVRFMPDSLSWLRTILVPWVGILAATILVIATNAGLIGVSRLTYSLGQHRQLPPILGRVHPKRMTPYVSIIVFGFIACLLIIPGSTGLLADLYVFGSMISFTAAHVSVIALRIREPDLERPWKPPFNIRVKGRLLPLTAIVGAHRHVQRVAGHRRVPGSEPAHRLRLDRRRTRHVRGLSQGQGLLPHEDGGQGRDAVDDEGGHRLRPDPRAHRRLPCHRRDDGARVPARHREEVVDRRPVRHRGAAQPAARRQAGERTRQGRQGAGRGGAHRPAVQSRFLAHGAHRALGRPDDRRRGGAQALRGDHHGDDAQAAHRRPRLREDHRLRRRPRALRGAV